MAKKIKKKKRKYTKPKLEEAIREVFMDSGLRMGQKKNYMRGIDVKSIINR